MIKQVTVFENPKNSVDTSRGPLDYGTWCNKEVDRLRRKGIVARTIRDRNGCVAVFSASGKEELEAAERAFG